MGGRVSSEKQAEYYQKNRKAKIAKQKEYYKNNRERCLSYSAEYAKTHPEKIAVISKKYSLKNKEKIAKYGSEWKRKNQQRVNAVARKSYYKNREIVAIRVSAWAKAHPEDMRARKNNRRSREKNAKGSHTAKDIIFLYEAQNGACICCQASLKKGYHVDHRVPLIRGGTNDRKNLDLLCPPCNLKKNRHDPIDFMRSCGFLC